MSGLWNPFAFGVTGNPVLAETPPALRVYGAEPTKEQLAMAQHAFARFCSTSRLSAVPNPTERGQLPDGSPYRIVVVGNTPIMEVLVGGVEDELILRGILLDFAGSTDQILLTPGGTFAAPNGVWAVTGVKGWMMGMSVWPELSGNRLPGWANNSWVSSDAKKWLVQDWYQNYFARGGKIVARIGATAPAGGVLGFASAQNVGAGFYEYTGLTFDGNGKIFSQSANIAGDLFANPPPLTQYIGLNGSDEILDVADLPATHFYFSNYCLNRHGNDVLVVTSKEGSDLLPYNGGSPDEENVVYLNYRTDHQLKLTNTYPPRLAWVSQIITPIYSVSRATQEVWEASAAGNSKVYGAPTATATPPSERIAYQAAPNGGVTAWPTYADVSFTGSIPRINTVRSAPNDTLVEGGGPVTYSEEFTCEFTDVYGAWFNADNSVCVIPETTKEEYHVTQSGAYQYRYYWKVWATDPPPVTHIIFDFLEDESSNMEVTRDLDRYVMLPMPGGQKKLTLAKHRFSETAVASHNITGTYDNTYGRLYNLNDTTTSAYSVEVEARELLLVDPFLDLLVYIECVYSYSRDTSTSSSYHYTTFGEDAGIRAEFPETWNRSSGGALPSLPAVTLVMECKGSTTRTSLSWGDDYEKENVRRSMAAAVAIPIDEPALSFGNTTSTPTTSNLMQAVWTLENCTRMFKAFPVSERDAGRSRTNSRAAMTRGVNVRGKLMTPGMNALVQFDMAKDPITGAAVLVLKSTGEKGLGSTVLAYTIDRTGARPLSHVLPNVDASTIIRAIPA